MALHGSGGNAESFQDSMARGGLDALAEREGFVVVYPNAAPGAHSRPGVANSGAWRQASADDGQVVDFEYLDLVLEDLERRQVLSGKNPLFLMGLSNGGGMVLEVAKRSPERVHGVGGDPAEQRSGAGPVPAPGEQGGRQRGVDRERGQAHRVAGHVEQRAEHVVDELGEVVGQGAEQPLPRAAVATEPRRGVGRDRRREWGAGLHERAHRDAGRSRG